MTTFAKPMTTHTAEVAHLLRRAGFGAGRDELERYAEAPYEEVVEDLLNPERFPEVEEDVLFRYFPHFASPDDMGANRWIYRMVNTQRPLQEKIALFWHHVFATAWYKSEHTQTIAAQIDTFRHEGLGNLRQILLDLSRDPAMIYWLDNRENHKGRINENYGRELLELFSMGIGNYTEFDIKEAARAFTGWTFTQPIPLYPYGHHAAEFVYRPEDHDDGEKTFLGHTGRFNGEDIIDIIVQQPATARFICRHLYNFFVADEPQVPSWSIEPPQDPAAVEAMVDAYFESDGEIRAVLRTVFNSDFFKNARFQRVKCPAEFVVSTIKLSGEFRYPDVGLQELAGAATAMGQQLMNPPTVEGWHTGREWIDGGTLNERVNFAVAHVQDPSGPGVQKIVDRALGGGVQTADDLVDKCLDLAGPLEASALTRNSLLEAVSEQGWSSNGRREELSRVVSHLLRLIVASPEFQFA